MQISNINNTQYPNFTGRLIVTLEAKKTLKMMSNNGFHKIKATQIINKLVDAQNHIEHYEWCDIIVDVKKSLFHKFNYSTLLTAPVQSRDAVERYRKNAIINSHGIFYSEKGDIIKEGTEYDFNQAEEQESLEKALEIADVNEILGNEAEKKKHLLSTEDKLKKLGIE